VYIVVICVVCLHFFLYSYNPVYKYKDDGNISSEKKWKDI